MSNRPKSGSEISDPPKNTFSRSEIQIMTDQDSELGSLRYILQYMDSPESPTRPSSEGFEIHTPTSVRQRRTPRINRKRSERACESCRSRKVRCSVSIQGPPCSNCKYDGVQCTVPHKNARTSAKKAVVSLETTGRRRSSTLGILSSAEESSDSCLLNHADVLQLNSQNKPDSDCLHTSQPHITQLDSSLNTLSWIEGPLATCTDPLSITQTDSPLSDIFSPFPCHVGVRDREYLKTHDALTLPSEEFQVELLKAYVEFVHGTLPVLDLVDFLSLVKFGSKSIQLDEAMKGSPPRQMSLLLFQAIMFAAVGYVDSRSLKEAGFESRQIAKKLFFNRVRLLYNFDTCSDRLTTIQSLLLMTLCPSNRKLSQTIKDAGHWLDLAISLAYVLGLNRNIPSQNRSVRKKHLERRIWWIAFIRDRTLSLRSSFGRRLVIAKEDCHIKMLSLEDFDLEENTVEYEGNHELRLKVTAVDCVEKAMMYWCGNDDLVSKFSKNFRNTPSIQGPLRDSPLKVQSPPTSQQCFSFPIIQDREHNPLATYAPYGQGAYLSILDKERLLWETDLNNHGEFESPAHGDIVSEYDDYFEYFQRL